MLFLKSCPKCGGDIYLDKDTYGAYKECLQCGYIQDIDRTLALPKQAKKQLVS